MGLPLPPMALAIIVFVGALGLMSFLHRKGDAEDYEKNVKKSRDRINNPSSTGSFSMGSESGGRKTKQNKTKKTKQNQKNKTK